MIRNARGKPIPAKKKAAARKKLRLAKKAAADLKLDRELGV